MKYRAFTLVELLVVVAIVGILSTTIVISINGAQKKARDTKVRYSLSQLVKQLSVYNATSGSYPLRSSGTGVTCYYSTTPKCTELSNDNVVGSEDVPDIGNQLGSIFKDFAQQINGKSSDNNTIYFATNKTAWTASLLLPSEKSSGKSIWTGTNLCASSAGKIRQCTSYPNGAQATSLCPDSGSYASTPPKPFTCSD